MKNNGIKIGLWNGIQLKKNSKGSYMTLLKMYQHHTYTYIFKFIYDSGYLYTTDNLVIGSTNSSLFGYLKVTKGYKYETNNNL